MSLQELVQQLRDAGFECGVSHDAGRFVCNYIYYKSLQMTAKLQQQLQWLNQQQQQHASNGTGGSNSSSATEAQGPWPCFSLFVHVPSFDVIKQGRQREFLLHLLDVLAKCVAEAPGGCR
jgi:hypothetical protein